MKLIYLNLLHGIPDKYSDLLKELLKNNTNKEKLEICLYFMSDLPVERHHLSEIEFNLRKIYYEEYIKTISDFQSSNIRGIINTDKKRGENKKVFLHLTDIEDISLGYWTNSDLGNANARDILIKKGINIISGIGINGDIDITELSNNEYKVLDKGDANDYGKTLQKIRKGQDAFRNNLIKAYDGKCCICGEDCKESLEAAHIQDYIDERSNNIANGLLLRADFHKLYDKNLIYIDGNYVIHISSQIQSVYYKKFDNIKLNFDLYSSILPSKEALELRKDKFIK